ncbi:hypothetical protein ACHAXT_001438 [Thalassiosira profunda]
MALGCVNLVFLIDRGGEIETPQLSSPTNRLGNGCHHVYLDAGANIGVHTRFLFEPHHYPKARNAHRAFNHAFGPPGQRDPRDICSFGFEPNPKHRERHRQLQQSYNSLGWRYFPIAAGVSDANGNMTFYEDNDPSGWGYSVVERTPNAPKEVVPVLHFAKWIEHHILNRELPPRGDAARPPSVVLKLDIEGMEMIVLPSLLFSGVMCRAIDVVFGEYHDSSHTPTRAAMDEDGRGELPPFQKWQDVQQRWLALWMGMKTVNPSDCKALFLDMFDEEDYLYDGVELPGNRSR